MVRFRTKATFTGMDRKLSDGNVNKGRLAVANQVLSDDTKYVPALNGPLRASGHVEGGGKAVVWQTPYAKAQYYGTNGRQIFKKYTTPGTGKQWHEKSKKANAKKWKETAVKALGVK